MLIHKKFISLLIGFASLPTLLLPISMNRGSVAEAGIIQGYVPPSNPKRPRRTQGAGSRGCSEGKPISLNLITPKDHVPTTISGHPNFLWYVSAPALMSFAITEPNIAKPILEKQLRIGKAGIVQLELPAEIAGLEEGKEYRWTVSIICNENSPSDNIYARSWIKRIPTTPNLKQKLATATQERERAAVYAQNSVWFDAISTIYQASKEHPRDRLTSEYLTKLLDQIGLSNLATQEQRQVTLGLQPKEK